ncbi:MAG: M48 family metallopeptidase [Sedimentisphaerales bacterium]|nr:M48 family metallopeptidase [Sedimentisphaerales bacterium]
MTSNLFYNLGRRIGPKVRKVRWMWESLAGTEADAIRLERGVGLDLAHEARLQLTMDCDPQTVTMLDEIGGRLSACVANRLRSFRFDAFEGGQPNAFALPGGFIFVSRPILELCQWDKDQIAFVLAHEMAHVIRRHAIERIVTNSAVSMAARASPVRGAVGAWLRSVGLRFLETAYSRDQELEADNLGVRLVTAAEYRPQACIVLFSRLAELNKAADPAILGEYFSTHPSSDVRIRNIRLLLQRHR